MFICKRTCGLYKRACGPLETPLFHHRCEAALRPLAKIEAAYHKAEASIQKPFDALAA